MNKKISRNDPCPCGSGKKYKQCCMTQAQSNAPQPARSLAGRCIVPTKIAQPAQPSQPSQPKGPNLMQETFGQAISGTEPFQAI